MAEFGLPLDELRVLDLSDEAGVFGAKLLADLGADVVRLEAAGGDEIRTRGPFFPGRATPNGSFRHLLYNSGKRSLVFEPGRLLEAAEPLLAWAEIVIAPMNKSAEVERLLDAERLAETHPHVAVVDTVFRRRHPDIPGSDLAGTAAGGLAWLTGFPGDPPNYPAGHLASKQVSLAAAFYSTVLAYARPSGYNARAVTISMQEAVNTTTIQSGNENAWPWEGRNPSRHGGVTGGAQSVFQAADGRWVSFTIPPPYWSSFAHWVREVLGLEAFLANEWKNPAFRAGKASILAATKDLCSRFPRTHLVDEGQARHLLVLPVNSVADLATDPHLVARGFFASATEPALGKAVVRPQSPFFVDGRRVPQGPAPALGANARDTLEPFERPPVSPSTARRLPLEGVRVVDFCWLIAGSLGTRLLADLGAEVIKIESAARMDRIREGIIAPPSGATVNTSPVFNDCNTNKRCITLNLGSPEGIAIAKRLIVKADIVSSNFTPDRMDRWGLGFEALRAIKPDIIAASMPVMGKDGPHNAWGSYGNGVIAMSGISSLTGFANRPPVGLGPLHSDFTAPYFMAMQLVAALRQRQRTGKGQCFEIAQLETAVWLLDTELIEHANTGYEPARTGNRSRFACPHGIFRAAGEDAWVALSAADDRQWKALCRVIGRPDLGGRTDLATLAGRKANENEIESAIAAWTSTGGPDAAAAALIEAGIAASPVRSARELLENDPDMAGFYVPLPHEECGTILTQNQPITIDGERLPLQRAPFFGEHTFEVLNELLGIDDDEFAKLAADGVLS